MEFSFITPLDTTPPPDPSTGLPKKAIWQIFSFLDMKDLSACSLMSKSWAAIVRKVKIERYRRAVEISDPLLNTPAKLMEYHKLVPSEDVAASPCSIQLKEEKEKRALIQRGFFALIFLHKMEKTNRLVAIQKYALYLNSNYEDPTAVGQYQRLRGIITPLPPPTRRLACQRKLFD